MENFGKRSADGWVGGWIWGSCHHLPVISSLKLGFYIPNEGIVSFHLNKWLYKLKADSMTRQYLSLYPQKSTYLGSSLPILKC